MDSILDPTVDALDLEAQETGIPWYKDMSKLSHELLTLRHLQGHVGQLSELLMARGIDTDWIGKVRRPASGTLDRLTEALPRPPVRAGGAQLPPR